MATKKSELYSSLWAGCDALRGSMEYGSICHQPGFTDLKQRKMQVTLSL
jgi:hypothetical protein